MHACVQGAEVRSWPVWTRLWPTRSSRKSGSSTQQLWQTSPPKSPSPTTNLTTSSTTTTRFTTPHTILVAVQQWWLVATVPRPLLVQLLCLTLVTRVTWTLPQGGWSQIQCSSKISQFHLSFSLLNFQLRSLVNCFQ